MDEEERASCVSVCLAWDLGHAQAGCYLSDRVVCCQAGNGLGSHYYKRRVHGLIQKAQQRLDAPCLPYGVLVQ